MRSLFRGMGVCALAIATAGAAGCGKKDKAGKNATGGLAMTNGTPGAALVDVAVACPGGAQTSATCYTPTEYGLKVLGVYVSPDAEGAKSAPAGLIWANPDCSLKTSSSSVGSKTYEYESASDCTDDQVSTYFELARPSAEVNADLNSQPHKILPGTYNYVQMAFCIGGPKTNNVQFTAPGMTAPLPFSRNTCGITSAAAVPPIVVKEGESVTVNLSYDLTGSVIDYGSVTDLQSNCYTNSDKTVVRCMGDLHDLSVGFTKK